MDLLSTYIELNKSITTLTNQRFKIALEIIQCRYFDQCSIVLKSCESSKQTTKPTAISIMVGDLNEVISEDTIDNIREDILDMLDDGSDYRVYAIEFDINGYMVFHVYWKGESDVKE